MKKIIIIALALAFQLVTFAQNQDWRPIRYGDSYYYDNYYIIRIDSINTDDDITYLYGYNGMNFNEDIFCYNPFGSPWFGKEIINYPDYTIIKNRNNENLSFQFTNSEKWIFYSNTNDTVFAQITGTKTMDFIGLNDSVKVIKLSSNSLDEIPSEIILSKNYGLIETFNFSIFSNNSNDKFDHLFKASLSGIKSLNIGEFNIVTKDIFNFEVNDEIHIKQFHYDYYLDFVIQAGESRFIKRIIKKEVNEDNMVYTIERCYNKGIDTIVESYPTHSALDSFPFNPTFDDELVVLSQFESKYGLSKGIQAFFWKQDDSCYTEGHYDKKRATSTFPISRTGYYVKGLGGPFNSNYIIPMYYKKGDNEWGTPFNCDDLQVGHQQIEAEFIKVYPNPVQKYLTIETEITNSYTISFYSLNGQLLQQNCIENSYEIVPINDLPNGSLLYTIDNGKEIVKKGKLVKKN